MFHSLQIENIQSHKDSTFEFVPGMNVIVGATGSGKSAVIRSLRLLRYNKPSGTSYISWWADRSKVVLKTTEGHTITRQDGVDRCYILDDLAPFKAFGQGDIPKEIADVLNMDDTNLQLQHDPHFLISKTPGEVAQHFNRIAKFDKIDSSISNVKSWIRSIDGEITADKKLLAKKQTELSTYDFLDKTVVDIEVAEELSKQIDTTENRKEAAKKLVNKLYSIQSKLVEYDYLETLLPLVTEALELYSTKNTIGAKADAVDELVESLTNVQTEIYDCDVLITLSPDVLKALELIQERNNISQRQKSLKTVVSGLKRVCRDITDTEALYETLHTKFDENFPDVCPLCSTILKK